MLVRYRNRFCDIFTHILYSGKCFNTGVLQRIVVRARIVHRLKPFLFIAQFLLPRVRATKLTH